VLAISNSRNASLSRRWNTSTSNCTDRRQRSVRGKEKQQSLVNKGLNERRQWSKSNAKCIMIVLQRTCSWRGTGDSSISLPCVATTTPRLPSSQTPSSFSFSGSGPVCNRFSLSMPRISRPFASVALTTYGNRYPAAPTVCVWRGRGTWVEVKSGMDQ